jgi:hypothetical protein
LRILQNAVPAPHLKEFAATQNAFGNASAFFNGFTGAHTAGGIPLRRNGYFHPCPARRDFRWQIQYKAVVSLNFHNLFYS